MQSRENLNDMLSSILSGAPRPNTRPETVSPSNVERGKERQIEFSVIFFSDVNQTLAGKYQLVFDLCDFADKNGFAAVWVPERHFHPFGGIYPNPAILASALAVRTERLRIRSGSVVLPLHHPVELVEAWSMVDNLSKGRVDLGFASGWDPDDFILSPETFATLRQVWHDRIPLVQRLWRGETLAFRNGRGELKEIQVYPARIQKELKVWLTATKSDESFVYAGSKGYNVLTMLQGIDLDQLGGKIRLYRNARKESGLDESGGTVTLMLHTFVNANRHIVEEAVRKPFIAYIKSALTGHIKHFKPNETPTEAELDKIVDYSYERYFKTAALFGSVTDAKTIAQHAMTVGVNEIACLMDFGVDYQAVMDSLPYLLQLKEEMVSTLDKAFAAD
jgi:natural product biosynthesis luciferase-like monooxygenase protein